LLTCASATVPVTYASLIFNKIKIKNRKAVFVEQRLRSLGQNTHAIVQQPASGPTLFNKKRLRRLVVALALTFGKSKGQGWADTKK
jgi:hypothetical protein